MTTTTNRKADQFISARKDFNASNLRGERTTPNYADCAFLGRLDRKWRDLYVSDRPVYVVSSYATPIAWIAEDGTVRVPDARYSVTTSRHQGIAADALTGDRYFRSSL